MTEKIDARAHLYAILAKICKLIENGERNTDQVSDVLERIENDPSFYTPFILLNDGITLREWQRFYKEVFGLDKDFNKLKIPIKIQSFNWLIAMSKGITLKAIWQKLTERMPAWSYINNLENIISDRNKNEDYAIRIRNSIEADRELTSKSADDLKRDGIQSITLPEYIMFEIFYHWETNGHLDLEDATLCSGSRDTSGNVPYVKWDANKVRLRWDSSYIKLKNQRARQIIL